jgi:hypothetical protein
MTAAYFEDHPTDPDKMIMRKPMHPEIKKMYEDYFDKCFAESASKRTWVGLTAEERDGKRVLENGLLFNTAEAQVWEIAVEWAEQKLKEKNT